MKWKIGILCGVWAVFSLANLFLPDKSFSEAENRYLEQRPEPSAAEILNGDYMEDYEVWLTDQLALRDELVSVKAAADKFTGRGDSGGVYFGKDGYLLEMLTEVDGKRLERNAEAAADFLRRMEAEGIDGHFLMVPTGAYVMEDKLPAFAPELDQEVFFQELQKKIPHFLEAGSALRGAYRDVTAGMETLGTEEEMHRLYYRTDHHWTSLGAYYAYRAFCESKGMEAPALSEYETEVLSRDFYGTGYSRAGLYTIEPDTMTAMRRKGGAALSVDYGEGEPETSLYDRSFLEKRDKYRVYLKGNYPLTRISTSNRNGEKLLLIKDSYANTFVQFLVEDYEEIHMVDPRYFKEDLAAYAEENGITEVLFLYQIKNFAQDTALAGVLG